MEYLIISTNKNLRVKDWTPFDNLMREDSNNLDMSLYISNYTDNTKLQLLYKNELINSSLNRLSNYRWKLDRTFTKGKYIYFILIRPVIKPKPIRKNMRINLEESETFKRNYTR